MLPAKFMAAAFVLFAAIAGSQSRQADARPTYFKEFMETYPAVSRAQTVRCTVCHAKVRKKVRNNYGTALARELNGKNIKNAAVIIQAFRAIELEPSAIPGKTFGDLLEAGQLPGEMID